jgi:hypothetical protein
MGGGRVHALVRWSLSVTLTVLAASCGHDSAGQYPAGSDVDRFNHRVDAIDRAWEQFRVRGNACSVDSSAGSCLATALQSSGFVAATDALRAHVWHVERTLGEGTCRGALRRLGARLGTLRSALQTLSQDAGGAGSVAVLIADTHRIRSSWDASVAAENGSRAAC